MVEFRVLVAALLTAVVALGYASGHDVLDFAMDAERAATLLKRVSGVESISGSALPLDQSMMASILLSCGGESIILLRMRVHKPRPFVLLVEDLRGVHGADLPFWDRGYTHCR
jgi:hypothetical protein